VVLLDERFHRIVLAVTGAHAVAPPQPERFLDADDSVLVTGADILARK